MKKLGVRITALLVLTGLVSASFFCVYGLTSTKSLLQIEAIASVMDATEIPAVKPVPVPLPIMAPPNPVSEIQTVQETAVSLTVFGKAVDLTGIPIILVKDGSTMLPIRKLAEAMGYTVVWDNLIKAAVLQKNTESIVIKMDSPDYTWGALSHVFSRKTEVFRNRLYVPVDFITRNPACQVYQSSDSITVDSSGASAKQAITGEIEEITVYSNGLGLKVTDKKNPSLLLYVTDLTQITNYSTGAVISRSLLQTGTKAIFSYTAVPGEGMKDFFVLSAIEVVDQ